MDKHYALGLSESTQDPDTECCGCGEKTNSDITCGDEYVCVRCDSQWLREDGEE